MNEEKCIAMIGKLVKSIVSWMVMRELVLESNGIQVSQQQWSAVVGKVW